MIKLLEHTTQTPAMICRCGARLDACSNAQTWSAEPRAGAVTICCACACVYIFENDLSLRRATIDELVSLMTAPEFRRVLSAVKILIGNRN